MKTGKPKRVELEVVCALIPGLDGTVFMGKRSATLKRPSMWEYPGGKVKGGEDLKTALKRELKEEIGVEAVVGDVISCCDITFEVHTRLTLLSTQIQGEIILTDSHSEHAWVRPEAAMKMLPMVPTAYLFYPDIMLFTSQK